MLFLKKRKLIVGLTALFSKYASNFDGLYNGIDSIISKKGKKNNKALDEFYKRVSFIQGYENLSAELSGTFPTSNLSPKKLAVLNEIFVKSMENAHIYHTNRNDIITLTKDNALHYQEWNGNEIYVDSKVKIVFPAWYQKNILIEKGFCSLIE